jgi:MoxR-like ATPase
MSEENTVPEVNSAAPPPADDDVALAQRLATTYQTLSAELGRRIVGQREVIEALAISLFARGHSLFVGVPGLAKTLLISTLAEAMSLTFRRIQFTPDLMPADITGTEILEEDRSTGRRELRFLRGPIFANILLADEINRTPPKTQAALLEAMQEQKVTAGGTTYPLEPPFLVFATQNPIEQEGTYPLPEAQLDRFLFSIRLDYPSVDEEIDIVRRTTRAEQAPIRPVIERDDFLRFQDLVRRAPTADSVVRFAVELVRRTRPKEAGAPEYIREFVSLGGGPRASQSLVLAGKARALLQGRLVVSREDVLALAPLVLRHRLVPNFRAEAQGVSMDDLIARLGKEKL